MLNWPINCSLETVGPEAIDFGNDFLIEVDRRTDDVAAGATDAANAETVLAEMRAKVCEE